MRADGRPRIRLIHPGNGMEGVMEMFVSEAGPPEGMAARGGAQRMRLQEAKGVELSITVVVAQKTTWPCRGRVSTSAGMMAASKWKSSNCP
jgi:hypothetical protein